MIVPALDAPERQQQTKTFKQEEIHMESRQITIGDFAEDVVISVVSCYTVL